MADLGEWDQAELKFKETEYRNLIEREQIAIERLELEKKEISLKIANIDLDIEKRTHKQETLRDQAHWCKTKLMEKQNDRN
jgi:hypothetical protein